VLDDQDRIRLTPYVGRLRRATANLAENRERLASAEHTLEPMAGGDWQDRYLCGLFSRDGRKAQQYRDAVRAQKHLTKLIAEQETLAERLAAEVDDLLEPILRRSVSRSPWKLRWRSPT
jgi:hypothetical protein